MEPRFGRDFSHVQVHADADAAESARTVGARAYAVGRHIVFGKGEASFATNGGRNLLAHELAHVVQQDGDRLKVSADRSLASALLLRSPLRSAKAARSTFAQLENRALQIYREAVTDSLRAQGRTVTKDLLSIKKRELTVAVLEGEKDGQIVTRIAINNPRYAPHVQRALREGELYVEKGSSANAHAEITGARGASIEGIEDALVATSNKGCPHCVQTIDRDFPELGHGNPKIASRGLVERSGRVARPVTTTEIDLEPGKKYKQRTPPRDISHSRTITGEIDSADPPATTPSGDLRGGPSVIVDDAAGHPNTPTLKSSVAPPEGGVPMLADIPGSEGGFFARRLSAVKSGLTEGVEAAFSPEGIASAIPMALLAIADRAAAREAVRNIRVKFEKEGFAKGVAASVMRWSPGEVALNLKNHVTSFRLEHLEDPAGLLSSTFIFQYAEANENYAVDVGFRFGSRQTPEWKKDVLAKGFAALRKLHFHLNEEDAQRLFEYDFIRNLADELRSITDPLVDQSIEDGKKRLDAELKRSRNEGGCVGMKC